MKKNLKVGLMAGLLITPAIVAQAGEVQASVYTDALLAPYNTLNEIKAQNLETLKSNLVTFKGEGNSDGASLSALDPKLLDLLTAKVEYITQYQILKDRALKIKDAITALKVSNGSFITDYKQIEAELVNLKSEYVNALQKLELATKSLQTGNEIYANNLVKELKYYKSGADFLADSELFVNDTISASTMKSFNDKKILLNLENDVIEGSVNDLIVELQDASSTETSITNKAAIVSTKITALNTNDEKTLVKAYTVTITLGEESTKVSVEELLSNIKTGFENVSKVKSVTTELFVKPPSSASMLKSQIGTIETTYNKIPSYLKRFVNDFDATVTNLKNTLTIVEDIDAVLKETKVVTELISKISTIKTAYSNLGSMNYTNLVTNYKKLETFDSTLNSIKKIEEGLATINADTTVETISEIIKEYRGISTANQKYFTTLNLAKLKQWDLNEKTAIDVDNRIVKLTTTSFAKMGSATTTIKQSTTKSFIKSVDSVYQKYSTILTTDTAVFDPKSFVKNRNRLEALNHAASIAETILNLSTLSTRNEEIMTAAATKLTEFNSKALGLTSDDQQDLHQLETFLKNYLDELFLEKTMIEQMIIEIDVLQEKVDLLKLVSIRENYNGLSKEGKNLLTNFTKFVSLEKLHKEAINVTNQIEKIEVGAKDFVSKTNSAKKNYEKLPSTMKDVVTNAKTLAELHEVSDLMGKIDKLRTTDKTFRTQLVELNTKFEMLTANVEGTEQGEKVPTDKVTQAKQRLLVEYGKKLKAFDDNIDEADKMITQITNLSSLTGQAFMDSLANLTAKYKLLGSSIKPNVTNSALLMSLEKDYKNALKVYNLIEQLPANTDKNYPSKVAAAEKANQKLSDKQKGYVFNYATKLTANVKSADIIARINKLKIGSKTYEADVLQLRSEYGALTPEQKALVHNIKKLDSAESSMADAEDVVKLINIAIPTAENYIQKLIDARNSYDSLSKSDQKLVLNYKDLTTRERAVKPVLKLDADILALDPSNARTFISKYNAAGKAYEKLLMTERALLLNTEKFLGDFTSIFKVMNAINSIKPSSKTFVEETQAARALFNALPVNLATQISNLATLQEHELNVEGGAKVDAMIRALNSVPPNEFISKIKEAREAFKSLNSANKKGVTLESELKEQEKYIKPIEAAINAIEGLSNPRNDLSRQFNTVNNALKKLDDKQKQYVTNMDQYSNLSNVIYVYTLIAGLKPNDKYFQGNMEAAKLAYDKLSEEEKLKVTNYYKLQQAVLDMTEVQKVMTIIASLNSTSSNFETDVSEALAAYKALPSGSKRQVLNYSELQQAERDLKAAQRVIKQIDDLDSTLRTYASRAKSAKTAYERLTVDQKALVKNYNKLQAAIFELGL